MIYGFFQLPVWGYILVTLALTHFTIIAVTVYLHRHQAHRGLELHPVVSHVFRFWLWLTTGMVTREWVAIHRKHHAFCETEQDPHSPQVKGLSAVLWRGAELYGEAAGDREMLERYGRGTPDDWIERNLYSRRSYWGPTLMAFINLGLFGVVGITIWAVQMLWIPFWAAGIVNGVGHFWGYRNYEPKDASRNVSPIGLIIGGEELHNNHHAFPGSAKLSSRPWEFDIGWFYIRSLSLLGLARVKRVAPTPVLQAPRPIVDSETATAVASSRLHVMASYGKQVLLPTLRLELQQADASCRLLFRQARQVLLREASLIDSRAKERLDAALDRSRQLRVVYDFRERLHGLWDRSINTQEALVQRLQTWCNEAEATGIQALQDFSAHLRGYAMARPSLT